MTLLLKGEFAQGSVPLSQSINKSVPCKHTQHILSPGGSAVHHSFASPPNYPINQEPKSSCRTNLASAEPHDQVSNEGVFCLSRAVAHHHTPAIGLGQLAAARDQENSSHHALCPAALAAGTLPRGAQGWPWYRPGSQHKVMRSCCHRHSAPGRLFRASM